MSVYLDLFSGIGGFHLGFERAGWKFDKVYFSEIDKYATQIYQRHFPNAVGLGDVAKIKGAELGEVDLITFGFPCQDLSIAGKRRGLTGSRSGLFFEATRLIRECKPDIFIFENVEGLLTSNDGKDFEVVLREIADIGLYECEWQLLNTKWFLPQNRERIYFIGHLAGRSGSKIFPIGESGSNHNGQFRNYICKTVRAGGGRSLTKKHMWDIVSIPHGFNEWGIKELPSIRSCNSFDKNEMLILRDGRDNRSCQRGGRTLEVGIKGRSIRRLTPVECERLQGFPDNWTEGVAETQRYKCLGNAVTVDVVAEIAKRLNPTQEK